MRQVGSRIVTGLLVAGLGLLGLLLLAFALSSERPTTSGRQMASALLSGYGAEPDSAVHDPAPDEIDAGYMWARSNRPGRAADCPAFSSAFRQGCADYIAAQPPGR